MFICNGRQILLHNSHLLFYNNFDLITVFRFGKSTLVCCLFVSRFGSGSSIGYYECIPTTKPCPASYKLTDPVNEGFIIDIDTLGNFSDRIYALNYSTTTSMFICT